MSTKTFLLWFAVTVGLVPLMSSLVRKLKALKTQHQTSAMHDRLEFPASLAGFGYAFNEAGQLRRIDPETGKPGSEGFQFNVKPDDPAYNQQHYEALGEVINEYVYELLEKEASLKRVALPTGSGNISNLKTFVFVSEDFETNVDKLLLLVHGSGVVRAGQWARRLIINEDLSTGTQLPFIEWARREGYAVVVANTNDNFRTVNGKRKAVAGSETAEDHIQTVWRHLNASPAKHVAVIAHSYGGVCTLHLASEEKDSFTQRTFAVAFTDSVHYAMMRDVSTPVMDFLRTVGRNWVASDKPVDTPVSADPSDIPRVSAGHRQHEMTSYSSMESIFAFLRQRYDQVAGSDVPTKDQ